MIDFTKEAPLSLAAVAKRFRVANSTVQRWVRGVGGRQLETAKVGGKRFTSLEAIQRFSQQGLKQKSLPAIGADEDLPLFTSSRRPMRPKPKVSKRSRQ